MTKSEMIEHILTPIEAAGKRCWFVGGCVRDSFLGKQPHDYDIATDATPEELHKIFKAFGNDSGEKFGVTIIIINHELYEIATLREDITTGRHPKVTFTDCIQEDSQRRDFTMNALYERADGRVFDPTGSGKEDIANGVLRFVGDAEARCREDPLRVVRFVRFLISMALTPADEETTFATLERITSEPGFFEPVSKERGTEELRKIFTSEKFRGEQIDRFFDFVERFHLETVFSLEGFIDKLKSCPQNPAFHAEGSEVRLLEV